MKFAPIAPTFNTDRLGDLSSYHFILANEVAKDLPQWKYYCDRWRRRSDFIILDNGTVEEGVYNIDDYVDMANELRVDEVILPDILGDCNATLRLIRDNQSSLSAIPRYARMYVPQGKTIEEWEYCYVHAPLNFRTLGVPKRVLNAEPLDRVKVMKKLIEVEYQGPIHLLGMLGHPLQDLRNLREIAWRVRGMDSAAPCAWAQHDSLIMPTKPDSGTFSVDLSRDLTPPQVLVAEGNIFDLQRIMVNL